MATKQDPVPGWIDNMYGPTSVVVSSGIGVMRSMYCHPDVVADIVPVDMVINALMAVAWQLHRYINYVLSLIHI